MHLSDASVDEPDRLANAFRVLANDRPEQLEVRRPRNEIQFLYLMEGYFEVRLRGLAAVEPSEPLFDLCFVAAFETDVQYALAVREIGFSPKVRHRRVPSVGIAGVSFNAPWKSTGSIPSPTCLWWSGAPEWSG